LHKEKFQGSKRLDWDVFSACYQWSKWNNRSVFQRSPYSSGVPAFQRSPYSSGRPRVDYIKNNARKDFSGDGLFSACVQRIEWNIQISIPKKIRKLCKNIGKDFIRSHHAMCIEMVSFQPVFRELNEIAETSLFQRKPLLFKKTRGII